MKYKTKKIYTGRQDKSDYVFDKYGELLKGSILDVGADAMYLKSKVEKGGGQYTGIGFGDAVDLEIDLDHSSLPFDDKSFDTVACFDVLEHLEKIHFVFKEICRVSKKHVIISLPNCYRAFFLMLKNRDYSPGVHIKFYGLPSVPPDDRHRWFFSIPEARAFLEYNAEKQGYRILQMDCENEDKALGEGGIRGMLGKWFLKTVFRPDIDRIIGQGTLWCVLEREG